MLVSLIRHGQSEHNAGLTTFLDSHLTPLGRKQATATGRRLRAEGVRQSDKFRAFVSPLRRTLETLEASHEETQVTSEVLADVCEYFAAHNEGYKTFDGLSPSEIAAKYPFIELTSTFSKLQCWWPSVLEDDQAIYDRVSGVRDALIERYFGTGISIYIFSHADPIGHLVESFLRIGPSPSGPPWSDNCGISRLRIVSADQPAEVVFLNDTSHLAALGIQSPQ